MRFDIVIVPEPLLITQEDLLIFLEKSWKTPGINESENYKKRPGKF